MTKLRVLSLFAGIGGFDLGLERTGGFETVAFCEIDPFCQRVLAKHWPGVPCYDDVRTLTSARLAADGVVPDVVVGGFPCQDISTAGAGAGIEGERSGLWSEYARLIGEVRPSYVIVENVAALLSRGLGRVLGDLASIGYDAEWHCIPASAVGALHRRDRLWIVGHPNGQGKSQPQGLQQDERRRTGNAGPAMADTECRGLQGGHEQRAWPATIVPTAFSRHCGGREFGASWWVEPDVGRVAHGIPDAMDRLKSLGNAVVPQIPELIGNAILANLAEQREAA